MRLSADPEMAPVARSSWQETTDERAREQRGLARRYARRCGLCAEDAEDIAARWLLHTLTQSAAATGESRIVDLLLHNGAYHCRSMERFVWREARQRREQTCRETPLCDPDFTGAGETGLLATSSAEEEAMRLLFKKAFSVALLQLPTAQQQAFVWRHVDGLDVPQIAERLQRTEQATRQLLHRACVNLRKPLSEWDENS